MPRNLLPAAQKKLPGVGDNGLQVRRLFVTRLLLSSLVLSSVALVSPARAQEGVAFSSGPLTLHGVIYIPKGAGPFPVLLYNHGSAPDNTPVNAALGPLFAHRGWVFFMPSRRGQGLSASAGFYIAREINAAVEKDGLKGGMATMTRLLETEQLNDQLAALDWLKGNSFVQTGRIAVAGNSFGGVEAVLGADRGSYCAAVDISGGAESWTQAPELQSLMARSARNAHAPIFFIQPENDYTIAPSRTLSAAMKLLGKPNEMKIYPPFGNSREEVQAFAYKGADIWTGDVFQFLDQYCPAKP